MAYDLEEQDQLDALKTWWKVYGNMVSTGVLVLAATFAAYRGWEFYTYQKATQASVRYEALNQLDQKDTKAIKALSAEIMDKYASTPYAGRAAVTAAKTNYQTGDVKSAKAQLDWAIKNAKEESVKTIALLQLASIDLEEKNYDAALKSLAEEHASGFDGLFADLKGDVYVAQGKPTEAKAAYKEALEKLDADGRYQTYTKMKLESLGS